MTKETEKAIKHLKANYRAANGASFEKLAKPMQDAILERYLREQANTNKADETDRPKEINGRNGPEPTRFGDWESKGIISDF